MIGSSAERAPKEQARKPPGKIPRAQQEGSTGKSVEPEPAKHPEHQVAEAERQPVKGEGSRNEPGPEPAKKIPPLPSRTTLPASAGKWMIPARLGKNKRVIAFIIVLIIAGIILISTGLLTIPLASSPVTKQDSGTLPVTTAPVTETIATGSLTPAVTPSENISLVPGPTQTLPAQLEIVLQTERDPRTKEISVEYMGGKGQNGVREIVARLTRSDGEILTSSFKPIQIGSSIRLQGTEQVDRLEVIVRYYSGEEFIVIDRIFEYKVRSP
jgi:hypothetical protein